MYYISTQAAGNAVKRASDNLVKAAQKAAFDKTEDDSVVVKTKFVGGIAQVRQKQKSLDFHVSYSGSHFHNSTIFRCHYLCLMSIYWILYPFVFICPCLVSHFDILTVTVSFSCVSELQPCCCWLLWPCLDLIVSSYHKSSYHIVLYCILSNSPPVQNITSTSF